MWWFIAYVIIGFVFTSWSVSDKTEYYNWAYSRPVVIKPSYIFRTILLLFFVPAFIVIFVIGVVLLNVMIYANKTIDRIKKWM